MCPSVVSLGSAALQFPSLPLPNGHYDSPVHQAEIQQFLILCKSCLGVTCLNLISQKAQRPVALSLQPSRTSFPCVFLCLLRSVSLSYLVLHVSYFVMQFHLGCSKLPVMQSIGRLPLRLSLCPWPPGGTAAPPGAVVCPNTPGHSHVPSPRAQCGSGALWGFSCQPRHNPSKVKSIACKTL